MSSQIANKVHEFKQGFLQPFELVADMVRAVTMVLVGFVRGQRLNFRLVVINELRKQSS